MEKFTTLTGIAAPLPMINVDTDMIIPKQYLKTIKRTGLGKGLFAELRYDEEGKPHPHFVLHKAPYTEAKVGRRVEVVFEPLNDDITLPQFRLADAP